MSKLATLKVMSTLQPHFNILSFASILFYLKLVRSMILLRGILGKRRHVFSRSLGVKPASKNVNCELSKLGRVAFENSP